MTPSTSAVPAIEIGSLTATSPDESQFIGSSSGIFFVNTVQKAFANSKISIPQVISPEQPYGPVETCIVGHESRDRDQHNSEISCSQSARSSSRARGLPVQPLGVPPSREIAKELVVIYFQVWHPLFPFLHGPTFVQDVEAFYAGPNGPQVKTRRKNCQATVLQCVFNIAALDRPDLKLPLECTIASATALASHLSSLATRHDIPTLQSLLAGQLYLIATMSLHAASTVGALIMRLILHGGFHRCPCRYAQLSTHDADVRKRVFWSAYVTDRYLSQALGLPLGIQDSDIDVCTPGTAELHLPVPRLGVSDTESATEVSLHLPRGSLGSTRDSSSYLDPSSTIEEDLIQSSSNEATGPNRRQGEDALANHVAYGKLTGRALEMFHKSITARVAEYDDVLELTSDIHSFWNALPRHLQDLPSPNYPVDDEKSSHRSHLGLYFTIIYQQLILLINRPFLSLEPSSARFRSSMQACIGASRTVISTLKEQTVDGTCIPWPGTLSVTWMSGLILAFACALDIYPTVKGLPEIQTCLELLNTMGSKWTAACHCHSALELLLGDLSSKTSRGIGNLNSQKRHNNHSQAQPVPSSKRQRSSGTQSNRESLPQEQVRNSVHQTLPAQCLYDNNTGFQTCSDASQHPWTQGQMYDHAQPCPNCPQDMFGHLSWESLVQNTDPSYDFWSNDFPEI